MVVSSNTYEEIFEILFCMDKCTVMKIPENVLKDIISKRNKEYVTNIDIRDIFNKDNMSEEAFNYLCWLDFEFWMDSEKKNDLIEEGKKRKRNELYANDKIYSQNEIINKKKKVTAINGESNSISNGNVAMIDIKKQNIISKIINKIKSLFI